MRILNTEDVIKLVGNHSFKKFHAHHTYVPNHTSFNGSNHIRINQNMKNYHVNNNGWSDIAQHLTLFPDGKWVTGRPLNRTPASIKGHNANALCIEMVGNFDIGKDKFGGKQKESMLALANSFGNKYGFHNIMFHNEASSKSCPGTSINKATFISEAKNYSKINDTLYRVQVGSFGVKRNADKLLKELESKGFDGFITTVKNTEVSGKSKYYTKNGLKVIEVNPEDVYVSALPSKNIRQFGVYGINGTWQNNSDVKSTNSIWGLVANSKGALGANSHQNSPHGYSRGTIVYYQDGELDIVRVNNISEFKKPINWAIGGGSLVPNLEPSEKFASDIFRKTKHTAIGYKGKRVFMVVSSVNCTMVEFRNLLNVLNLDKCIFLDGGGSSQMNYPGVKGLYSSRALSHGVFLKSTAF